MKFLLKTFQILSVASLVACSNSGEVIDKIQQSAGSVLGQSSGGLSTADITAGLKEALNKGTTDVVGRLGKSGGFSADQLIRIPLPASLQKAKDYADKFGLGGRFVELENSLNEAAELATPKAKALFVDAIKDMNVSDARGILQGPDDAATQYFQNNMSDRLSEEMRPIVDNSLNQVGAVRSFNSLLSAYRKLPLAPEINADLTQHVVDGGISGIFHYVAEEEKAIRENPAKRTSELLQRVFGS
ncbi:MAG: DUF4197 domain-containing protein [Gammaproteobacteria bacterium]|nr:DUF4197 domain-containing protein [Gammaproteobacteria bacterium]